MVIPSISSKHFECGEQITSDWPLSSQAQQICLWLATMIITSRSPTAARLIECDCHAHLVSKAGSVISSKSPLPDFRWSSIYYTEPKFSDKQCTKNKTKQ